jgi:hypothetical protein
MTTTFVDVERPVRDWLRTAALSGIDSRVYLGVPERATYPLIDVTLVDGGVQPGTTPLAVPRFQFSVWGDGPTADRETLQGIAWALVALLKATDYALSGSVALMGVDGITGPLVRYDPDGTPRYLIEAAVAMKVTA